MALGWREVVAYGASLLPSDLCRVVLSVRCGACGGDRWQCWWSTEASAGVRAAATLERHMRDTCAPVVLAELETKRVDFDTLNVLEVSCSDACLRVEVACKRCTYRASAKVAAERPVEWTRGRCGCCRKHATAIDAKSRECASCARSLRSIQALNAKWKSYASGALFVLVCGACRERVARLFARDVEDVTRDAGDPSCFAVRMVRGWSSQLLPTIVTGIGESQDMALVRCTVPRCAACAASAAE